MASGSITSPLHSSDAGADVRLRLKPAAPATGHVDGAWWPRSRDLATELPLLLAAVAERLGRVESVSYHLGDWDPVGRRVDVDGHVVRLSGFRFQRSDTVDVVGRRQRITLLVVPPEASPQRADDALDAGGDPGNTGTVDALLDPHPTGRKRP